MPLIVWSTRNLQRGVSRPVLAGGSRVRGAHESPRSSRREDPERRTVVPAASRAPVRDLQVASDSRTVTVWVLSHYFVGPARKLSLWRHASRANRDGYRPDGHGPSCALRRRACGSGSLPQERSPATSLERMRGAGLRLCAESRPLPRGGHRSGGAGFRSKPGHDPGAVSTSAHSSK